MICGIEGKFYLIPVLRDHGCAAIVLKVQGKIFGRLLTSGASKISFRSDPFAFLERRAFARVTILLKKR